MGGIVIPINTKIQLLERELRAAVDRSRGQVTEFHMGYQTYEGTRIYGVDFAFGGKKWEMSLAVNNPNIKAVHEGICHLLEVCLKDIKEKLSS